MVEKRLVWDLPTRVFHWLLALDILALYLSAEGGTPKMEWHFRFGYIALGLVTFRIIWGFVGPRHARARPSSSVPASCSPTCAASSSAIRRPRQATIPPVRSWSSCCC